MAFGNVIADALVAVRADTTGFSRDVEKGTGAALKKLKGTVRNVFVGLGAVSLFKDVIAEAQEARKVLGQTEAVISSTGGVAGVSAGAVGGLADKLSLLTGVDDEVIAQGENVLLTFTNIRNSAGEGNDIFDQTTKATLDLSAALGQDLQSSVIQVGKALNDPIKGVTALRRVGVSFTADQLKQIKALQTSGDLLGAQKIILGELNREFGGTAAAVATPLDKMKVAMKNVEETLGTALLPVLDKFSTVLIALSPILPQLIVGIVGIVAAVKIWTFAQTVLNLVMSANPISLVIIAIAALIGILFFLFKRFQVVRDVLSALWDTFKAVFNWIKNNWPLLVGIITGPIGFAIAWVIQHFDAVKNKVGEVIHGVIAFVKEIPGAFVDVFKGFGETLIGIFKGAIDFIIDAWNRLDFGIHIEVPSWVPLVGGKGFNIDDIFPDIPRLAMGGIVTSPTLAMIGEAGPEAVVPLTGPNAGPITQNFFTGQTDPRVLANELAHRMGREASR